MYSRRVEIVLCFWRRCNIENFTLFLLFWSGLHGGQDHDCILHKSVRVLFGGHATGVDQQLSNQDDFGTYAKQAKV